MITEAHVADFVVWVGTHVEQGFHRGHNLQVVADRRTVSTDDALAVATARPIMGGGLLQVDTFTAERYSPHWMNLNRTKGNLRKVANKTGPQRHTQKWQLPHTLGIKSCFS
jgi:hypothetical protein